MSQDALFDEVEATAKRTKLNDMAQWFAQEEN